MTSCMIYKSMLVQSCKDIFSQKNIARKWIFLLQDLARWTFKILQETDYFLQEDHWYTVWPPESFHYWRLALQLHATNSIFIFAINWNVFSVCHIIIIPCYNYNNMHLVLADFLERSYMIVLLASIETDTTKLEYFNNTREEPVQNLYCTSYNSLESALFWGGTLVCVAR